MDREVKFWFDNVDLMMNSLNSRDLRTARGGTMSLGLGLTMTAMLVTAFFGGAAQAAEEPLPRTSQMYVAFGASAHRSPIFAHRDGYVYTHFVNKSDRDWFARYGYPSNQLGTPYAFGGFDIIDRYPDGVFNRKLGPLLAGNPANAVYHEAAYHIFRTAGNKAKYEAAIAEAKRTGDPMKYGLPVGEHCLGSVSLNGSTPGDPQHALYVEGIGWQAIFGSANGPRAWAAIPPDQQRTRAHAADVNYDRRAPKPENKKIAAR